MVAGAVGVSDVCAVAAVCVTLRTGSVVLRWLMDGRVSRSLKEPSELRARVRRDWGRRGVAVVVEGEGEDGTASCACAGDE